MIHVTQVDELVYSYTQWALYKSGSATVHYLVHVAVNASLAHVFSMQAKDQNLICPDYTH